MLHAIKRWTLSHGILVRTICLALLIVCIPMMLFSYSLALNGRREILNAWENHSQSVAEAAAVRFSEIVKQVFAVSQSMARNSLLADYSLGRSVYGDREAVEALCQYRNALPYATSCGLYAFRLSDTVFTSEGKYERSIYLDYVLNMNEADFADLLSLTNDINFHLWTPDTDGLLCTLPVYPRTSAKNQRICLWSLSRANVLSAFSTVLSEGSHQLAVLFDVNGQPLFYNTVCPWTLDELLESGGKRLSNADYTCFFSKNVNGYSAAIFVPSSDYALTALAFESSFKLMIIVNCIVSLIIAAMLVWVNYRPVSALLRRIGPADSNERNEFQAILDAFATQEMKVSELERRNDENLELIRGHLIEKLLNGASISDDEAVIINGILGSGCFFAAIARLTDIVRPASLDTAVFSSMGVYPFEMRRDGYLTFLCRVVSPENRVDLAQSLQKKLNAPLGIGSIGIGWQKMHSSYLEAILAYDRVSGAPVLFYEHVKHAAPAEEESDPSMELMQLARTLKNGDASAIEQMDALFDVIARRTPSFFFQRYACYQLIESLRRILSKMDIPLSSERAAHILAQNTLDEIRSSCADALRESLETIRESASEQKTELCEQMCQLVEANYTDCNFGLDTMAEALNMTEYSVSRLFKGFMNVSFKKYLTCKRLDYAKDLLCDTDDSISEIAQTVGFSSGSYFIRIFKTEEGMTPSAFRQMSDDSHQF